MTTRPIVIADPFRARAQCMRSLLRRASLPRVELAQPDTGNLRRWLQEGAEMLVVGASEDIDAVDLCRQLRFAEATHAIDLPVMLIAPERASIRWTHHARNAGAHSWMPADFGAGDIVNAARLLMKFRPEPISSSHYRGPCRRHVEPADYAGPRRRNDEPKSASTGGPVIFDRLYAHLTELETRLYAKDVSPLFVRRHIMSLSLRAMRIRHGTLNEVFHLWGMTLERHGDMIASAQLREIVSAGVAAIDRFSPAHDRRLALAHLNDACRRAALEADLAVITVAPRAA